MIGQPANTRLTPEVAREVCQRTSSAATLEGSVSLVGNQYNLILRAVNCGSGGLLASAEAQANDKNRVLDALAEVASEIRAKLGESLSTRRKYNTPLEQASTSSLEALQAYSLGLKVWFSGDSGAAHQSHEAVASAPMGASLILRGPDLQAFRKFGPDEGTKNNAVLSG